MEKFPYKENNEIIKLLRSYIKKDLFKWQTKFPVYFYQELFRLNGWDFTTSEIEKRSRLIGKWVNRLVYDELPKNTLIDLEKSDPRMEVGNKKNKNEKLIMRDIGNPYLQSHINKIITLFQLSDTMENMWEKFKGTTDNPNNKDLKSPFEFDQKGHTIHDLKEEELSDFNKNLLKGLNWDPKKNKR